MCVKKISMCVCDDMCMWLYLCVCSDIWRGKDMSMTKMHTSVKMSPRASKDFIRIQYCWMTKSGLSPPKALFEQVSTHSSDKHPFTSSWHPHGKDLMLSSRQSLRISSRLRMNSTVGTSRTPRIDKAMATFARLRGLKVSWRRTPSESQEWPGQKLDVVPLYTIVTFHS